MLRTDALDYDLPPELIATEPPARRDAARMMVLDRQGRVLAHRSVHDLPEYLRAGDALIFNDSRVLPARFSAIRTDTGGRIEGLFLRLAGEPSLAEAMLRPGHRIRPGQTYAVEGRSPDTAPAVLRVVERRADHWLIRLERDIPWHELLAGAGHAPLPPYILRRRRESGDSELDTPADRARYQTVYARQAGAVAAPTAGLHFTPELLDECRARGAELGFITLHVGAGTFKPVDTEFIEQHPIHEEWYTAPRTSIDLLTRTRAAAGRVFAVGTTTVRTLESLPEPLPGEDYSAATRLMITPGATLHRVDGLLTNFHLPRSTLLALVAAMIGVEPLVAAYREAIARRYRFYSYGDCMLILP